jgi:hypothetical protein
MERRRHCFVSRSPIEGFNGSSEYDARQSLDPRSLVYSLNITRPSIHPSCLPLQTFFFSFKQFFVRLHVVSHHKIEELPPCRIPTPINKRFFTKIMTNNPRELRVKFIRGITSILAIALPVCVKLVV